MIPDFFGSNGVYVYVYVVVDFLGGGMIRMNEFLIDTMVA